MKYNDIIEILKNTLNAITDPMYMADKLSKSEVFKFPKNLELNNSIDNSIKAEYESSNKVYNESVPREDSKSYNDNKSNGYYNTSSNPQGVIDSITQELTSVRLEQAIILSEIVGKPRSKTRKKRRF